MPVGSAGGCDGARVEKAGGYAIPVFSGSRVYERGSRGTGRGSGMSFGEAAGDVIP